MPILDNKALKITSPETIQYAQARANAFKDVKFSAVEAQESVQILNKTLDQFYKDPSVATYGKSLVDSLVVNGLKSQLDSLIKGAKGNKLKQLKSEYSALRSIETDVAKAANRKRNQVKGSFLPDFTDILY